MAHVLADRVMETASTTGTGAFTLAGAYTGYRAFSAVMSVGDTCRYCIAAVDTNGNDSGNWEVGLGTYSSANTLTRTTVEASTNANAAVNFAAGNKRVLLGPSAAFLLSLVGRLGVDTVSGTTYTFVAGDHGRHKRFTSASAVTATVNHGVHTVGDRFRCTAAGAGQVTLSAGSNVTLNSRGAALKSAGQYAVFEVECVSTGATDVFDVLGDVTT